MCGLKGERVGSKASDAASRLKMAAVGWVKSFKLRATSGA